MCFVSQFFTVQIQVLHDAKVNEMAPPTANLDVIFLLHVSPNLTVVSQTAQIKPFQD